VLDELTVRDFGIIEGIAWKLWKPCSPARSRKKISVTAQKKRGSRAFS
jgi:hypothetical protein